MSEKTAQLMFETESELNTYYPLEFCLILESRLKQRREIVSRIRGSGLFREVFEPDSVAASLLLIEKKALDVCIIGPSLSLQSVALIVEHTRKSRHNANIAFITFGRENPADLDDLKALGVKNALPRKTSPRVFYEGLARAVLTSKYGEEDNRVRNLDSNSPFSIRLQNKQADCPIKDFGDLVIIDCVSEQDDEFGKFMFGHLLRSVESPQHGDSSNIDEIRSYVQLFAESNPDSVVLADFLRYFNKAYGEWFSDAFFCNYQEANRRFRKRILGYKRSSSANTHLHTSFG